MEDRPRGHNIIQVASWEERIQRQRLDQQLREFSRSDGRQTPVGRAPSPRQKAVRAGAAARGDGAHRAGAERSRGGGPCTPPEKAVGPDVARCHGNGSQRTRGWLNAAADGGCRTQLRRHSRGRGTRASLRRPAAKALSRRIRQRYVRNKQIEPGWKEKDARRGKAAKKLMNTQAHLNQHRRIKRREH